MSDLMFMAEDMEGRRALIGLGLVKGLGANKIRMLVEHFGSAQAAFQASMKEISALPNFSMKQAKEIQNFDGQDLIDAQLFAAEQSEATLLTCWDVNFPVLLGEIYDPPAFLWMRGNLTPADDKAIAIVGTRKATPYGKKVAFDFAFDLASQGWTIVSGLAYGIDTAAHEGALAAGGRTIAVFGAGVDNVYPAKNKTLADKIIQNGALLSEYRMFSHPEGGNFPKRNRIISGMSSALVVAEAFKKGGALITARLALNQNRDVFAVPAAINIEAGQGCNFLIRDGAARLVTSVSEILEELGEPSFSNAPVAEVDTSDFSKIEKYIWDGLTKAPIQLDDLCANLDLDVSTALVSLLSLEFRGLVRQMAGKQFYRDA